MIPPFRKARIEIEEIVAFQLEQRFGNWQLARVRHGVRHVIELRRVINRTKESGEVVEESIVAAADERFDCLAVRRVDGQNFVDVDGDGKTATRKVDESNRGPVRLIDRDANF